MVWAAPTKNVNRNRVKFTSPRIDPLLGRAPGAVGDMATPVGRPEGVPITMVHHCLSHARGIGCFGRLGPETSRFGLVPFHT